MKWAVFSMTINQSQTLEELKLIQCFRLKEQLTTPPPLMADLTQSNSDVHIFSVMQILKAIFPTFRQRLYIHSYTLCINGHCLILDLLLFQGIASMADRTIQFIH